MKEIKEEYKLIEFYANWCAPCRTFETTTASIEKKNENLNIQRIDIDSHPGLALQFGVRSIPALTLLRGETEIWRNSGMISEPELVSVLAKHLDNK
ncbi:thioredoxin [Dysgonomonas capnocytophagoides]|uniref:Thioredoxin n=1 Tax=Dysgonomonas capnocytophagoides TaxID=45254 RepID=A0A4Y8L752_9BACT|nr:MULTISPECIES: thioredoxin family protein [Dysgonomonas]MBD8390452.1 thioredoxin family protein [Dysgonomonas sp. BGC7]TFD96336.1 thioredoxin [Dysgonomonas capnocytophagoides]